MAAHRRKLSVPSEMRFPSLIAGSVCSFLCRWLRSGHWLFRKRSTALVVNESNVEAPRCRCVHWHTVSSLIMAEKGQSERPLTIPVARSPVVESWRGDKVEKVLAVDFARSMPMRIKDSCVARNLIYALTVLTAQGLSDTFGDAFFAQRLKCTTLAQVRQR